MTDCLMRWWSSGVRLIFAVVRHVYAKARLSSSLDVSPANSVFDKIEAFKTRSEIKKRVRVES